MCNKGERWKAERKEMTFPLISTVRLHAGKQLEERLPTESKKTINAPLIPEKRDMGRTVEPFLARVYLLSESTNLKPH